MDSTQLYVATVDRKRRYACSLVAVLVFIVDGQERVLLLSDPVFGSI
jgi:hypothetical protein